MPRQSQALLIETAAADGLLQYGCMGDALLIALSGIALFQLRADGGEENREDGDHHPQLDEGEAGKRANRGCQRSAVRCMRGLTRAGSGLYDESRELCAIHGAGARASAPIGVPC